MDVEDRLAAVRGRNIGRDHLIKRAPFQRVRDNLGIERFGAFLHLQGYTTAARASLSMNGKSIGEVACPDHICVWPNVALEPGPNQATVSIDAQPVFTGITTKTDLIVGQAAILDGSTFNGPDPAKDGIRIDVGDNAGRTLGARRFGSDNFVTGGTTAVLNMGGFGGRTSGPKKTVTAPDPALYDYWREGAAFSYAIPVPDGKWTVTIHSFEPRNTGSPMMSVSANGKLVVRPFNVSDAAGGSLKGLARSFPVKVKDGLLKLDIAATGGKAVVTAIEVTK